MKKKLFLSLIGLFVSLILSTYAFSLILYDDFSGAYIDKTKWRQGELVREIDPVNQRLLLKQASPSPIVLDTYPYVDYNTLYFSDPNSVNSIQTDVTILQNDITNQANTSARVGGRGYNDGTSGGGFAGDIWVELGIRWTLTGFKGYWYVGRHTGSSSASITQLGSGYFTTVINIGTPYRLFVSYDNIINQFLFKIGDEALTFGPTDLPAPVGPPNQPAKALQALVQINNSTSSGYISAAFDNVYVNGTLYDDFSSPTIDPTKWTDYEFVREISGGKLRSRTRSSSAYTSFVNNYLELLNPSSINAFQAKVTLVDYQNPQRLFEVADLSGGVYNDGTPGGGRIGDVVGQVLIGGTGTDPVAAWRVYKYTDTAGNVATTVASGAFTTPITLGNTYTLLLGWDGSQFTFKIGDEEAYFSPVTAMNPVNFPFKRVRTQIVPGVDEKEATIEALFDDVMVNGTSPDHFTLTISKSGTGNGTVTSSPAGINCGGECTEDFKVGTKITLKAKADTNSTFTGWSGGGCSGTGTCAVIMNDDATVTASFALKTPDISVPPSSLDFGSVKSGKKTTKTLKITNIGSGDLLITLSGLEGTDFSIQGSSSVTIKAKKSYSLKVLCTPISAGLKTATLSIVSNDPDTPTLEISLTATLPATTPDISVAQTSLDFGSVQSGKKVTKTLKIGNNGTGDLMITLSGLEETDFSIQGSSSVTIKGKKSYSLKVLFTPTSADLETATLKITSNDPDTPTIDISLSGTGQ